MRKKSIHMGILMLLTTAFQTAAASCIGSSGPLPITESYSPSFEPINPDVPVGSVLATLDLTLRPISVRLTCTSALGWIDQEFSGTPVNGVHTTNMPGVGYRHTLNTPSYFIPSNSHDFQLGTRAVRIELIKTAHIPVMTLINIAYFLQSRSHTTNNNSNNSNTIAIPFYISVRLRQETRPTCSLVKNNIPVNFGIIPIATVNGELAQRTVPIEISCLGGTAGSNRPVRMTLTDSINIGNRGSDLAIAPNNSGMHINLRYGSTLITFGPESSSAGNPGQFLLGNANSGHHTYMLTAHLMRNGPMRGLPAFSARATMTMRYE